jgi:hypothetical protein
MSHFNWITKTPEDEADEREALQKKRRTKFERDEEMGNDRDEFWDDQWGWTER